MVQQWIVAAHFEHDCWTELAGCYMIGICVTDDQKNSAHFEDWVHLFGYIAFGKHHFGALVEYMTGEYVE